VFIYLVDLTNGIILFYAMMFLFLFLVSHIGNGSSTSSEIQVSTSFINGTNNDQTTVTTFKPPNEHPNGNITRTYGV